MQQDRAGLQLARLLETGMELALIGAYGSGWRRAAMGSCTGGVATGWLWELLWRRDFKAARELEILDR